MTTASNHLSPDALFSQIEKAHREIEVGAVYVHYSNPHSRFRVTGLGILDASQEAAVFYQKESDPTVKSIIWVRAVRIWLEEVCVDGLMIARFQKVDKP